ncbi:trypsin-like serine protease [Actinomadura sp. ATCC 31491]|uniref:Trypsin-like serine protease n=1 Tax=Actinomadura luzonensis TaxID=2805427 RepID=A0ABT0FKS9_9ACTN|nr:trypsin-like serine protease [Actinomadura luzonensis]MCK2212918.1 trypsin-like serine protease [Actinomadura luzonensis]
MISRARHLLAAALGGALLVLPALTGIANAAASAAAGTTASAAAKVQSISLAKTAADVKRVADYWKPEKFKHADSYSPATPGTAAAKPTSAGGAAGPAAPGATRTTAVAKRAAGQLTAPALPRKGAPTGATMGKVFFRFGDKEYWCSASSVAARNRSVVATAGHCAYDPRQAKAADYWIFVPNPGPNGEQPMGIYVASSISLHEDWVGRGDYDYDYAFVTVHRGFSWVSKNGQYVMQDIGRLQDNVGGLGLELNRKPGTYSAASFGYPAGAQPDGSRPYDGKSLKMCREGRTIWNTAPPLDLQKGVQLQACDFSAGTSGGPWVIGYDQERRIGSLSGVNSLTWDRNGDKRYDAVSSPYFDTVTGAVYQRAATQNTPAKIT